MEINKEYLYKLYIQEQKTTMEIAHLVGLSSSTICNYLAKFNIPIRHFIKAQVNRIAIPKDKLVDLYEVQKKSLEEISNIFNCSAETIRRLCISYEIGRRPKAINFGGSNKGVAMSKKQKLALSTLRKNYYATHKHWNSGNSWSKEVRAKISKGLLKGRQPAPSFYGSEWVMSRTSCLKRDNYCCQQCESQEKLEVHHWVPYRFSFDNSLNNLVVLCAECHRELHQAYRNEGFIREAEQEFYDESL